MNDELEQQRAAARRQMVSEQLEQRGVRDERVLEAMRNVPREAFIPPAMQARAYDDAALGIDCQQTISQPYMVARMTELLELKPTARVLEIGTGSGYQTAILALLARHVYTIERHAKLMLQAQERLDDLGLRNVSYRSADGTLGWPEEGPFDGILVTAGAPDVPEPLRAQLAPGGYLVAPIGNELEQTLIRLQRTAEGVKRQNLFQCRFVKLVGEAGWRD